MSTPPLNLWDLEAAIVARIQAAAPAGVAIVTTFDHIDWTADDSPRLAGHLVFDGPAGSTLTGRTALLDLGWSFHVMFDRARANSTDRSNAQALYRAALQAITGWEYRPGKEAVLTGGRQTGFDPGNGLARLTLTFTTPAPVAGL